MRRKRRRGEEKEVKEECMKDDVERGARLISSVAEHGGF